MFTVAVEVVTVDVVTAEVVDVTVEASVGMVVIGVIVVVVVVIEVDVKIFVDQMLYIVLYIVGQKGVSYVISSKVHYTAYLHSNPPMMPNCPQG